jgi:hypothetical protein
MVITHSLDTLRRPKSAGNRYELTVIRIGTIKNAPNCCLRQGKSQLARDCTHREGAWLAEVPRPFLKKRLKFAGRFFL